MLFPTGPTGARPPSLARWSAVAAGPPCWGGLRLLGRYSGRGTANRFLVAAAHFSAASGAPACPEQATAFLHSARQQRPPPLFCTPSLLTTTTKHVVESPSRHRLGGCGLRIPAQNPKSHLACLVPDILARMARETTSGPPAL